MLDSRGAEHEENNEIAGTLQYLSGCPSLGALIRSSD